MKIYIKDAEGPCFKFYLPTSLLKNKLFRNIILKNNYDLDDDFINSIPIIYKHLKSFIKEYGHFNLIEIKSSDSNLVIIRV